MLRSLVCGDRWRRGWGLPIAVVFVLGDLPVAPSASAQGFGWGFYRAPAQRRRAPQSRRAPRQSIAPPENASPERPVEAPQEANVPLPVPRPYFPGDPPASVEATPLPAETKPDQRAAEPPLPAKPAEKRVADTEPRGTRTKPLFGPFKPPPAVEQPKAAESSVSPPAAPSPPASPPLPPPKPPELAKPDISKPGVAPSGARLGEAPGQPDDDATCQDRVKARGVEVEATEIGPQPDPRCTVVRAVRLNSLTLRDGGKISFPERPTIACPLADGFSLYIRDLLSPLAKGTYGSPIASVWTGPGLECRSRDHIQGAKLSAHGQGLAVDIAQLKLSDGRMFEVGRPKEGTDEGFETAARAGACGYFHTALGPGTDAFHATHWHFDIEVRGAHGDSKYCK